MKKVFISNSYGGFEGLMKSMFKVVNSMADADAVLFTGGPDVSPMLYGQKRIGMCGIPNVHRDQQDLAVYEFAKEHEMHMMGICRGAQFLNVMAGGSLIQHVANHGASHSIKTYNGQNIMVTSTHHQMMQPPKDAMLLGWADNLAGNDKYGENGVKLTNIKREPEVVWMPNHASLAFQYHPETMQIGTSGREFFHDMVEEFIL